MRTNNPMQLKAYIKKMAAEKNISAQLIMQNYMLERLLERISVSKYQSNLILKGGFLISAIVGLDTRATMDLDTTIKGFDVNHDTVRRIFEEIGSIPIEDDVKFEVLNTYDIREGDDYPGIRVAMKANYLPLAVPLSVDVTTGDKITPRAIEYSFKLLFDDRTIKVMAYNLETVLAEKLETIVTRGIANTRLRDFYDVYILYQLRGHECDRSTLNNALVETASKRKSGAVMSNYRAALNSIAESEQMKGFWKKYQTDFVYAKEIDFMEICRLIIRIFDEIGF
ncbi:nucleotidyl transferase AbiEii/AbiGii toxin family protein [Phosphitispora sp. TUW77]|uniref:nucleotidyl transferase AbiEii/AbiGii toxin family protein n=1 Tax=Phosphitispora sp. TUW77 TaxID=3152361 RepID=UPI003AB6DF01